MTIIIDTIRQQYKHRRFKELNRNTSVETTLGRALSPHLLYRHNSGVHIRVLLKFPRIG